MRETRTHGTRALALFLLVLGTGCESAAEDDLAATSQAPVLTAPASTLAEAVEEAIVLGRPGPAAAAAAFRDVTTRFSSDDGPNEYLRATALLGVHLDSLGDKDAAHAAFRRVAEMFDDLNSAGSVTDVGRDAAARAETMMFHEEVDRLLVNGVPVDPAAEKVLWAAVENVGSYGRARWTIAAYKYLGRRYAQLSRARSNTDPDAGRFHQSATLALERIRQISGENPDVDDNVRALGEDWGIN